jgi:hypothetical protein
MMGETMSQNATNWPIVHPRVIREHGDEDDADWGLLLTRPPELSVSPTSRDIWGK